MKPIVQKFINVYDSLLYLPTSFYKNNFKWKKYLFRENYLKKQEEKKDEPNKNFNRSKKNDPQENLSSNNNNNNNSPKKKSHSKTLRNQKSMDDFIIRKEPEDNKGVNNESVNNIEDVEVLYESLTNKEDDIPPEAVSPKKRFNGSDAVFNSKTNNLTQEMIEINSCKSSLYKETRHGPSSARVNEIKSRDENKIHFDADFMLKEDSISLSQSQSSIGSLNDLDSDDIIDVENWNYK